MNGGKRKPGRLLRSFLKSMVVTFLLLSLALQPILALTPNEAEELTLIYNDLLQNWTNSDASITILQQEQQTLKSDLAISLGLAAKQSMRIESLEKRLLTHDETLLSLKVQSEELKEVPTQLKQLQLDFQSNQKELEKVSSDFASSLKATQRQLTIYKALATGGIVLSIATFVGGVILAARYL